MFCTDCTDCIDVLCCPAEHVWKISCRVQHFIAAASIFKAFKALQALCFVDFELQFLVTVRFAPWRESAAWPVATFIQSQGHNSCLLAVCDSSDALAPCDVLSSRCDRGKRSFWWHAPFLFYFHFYCLVVGCSVGSKRTRSRGHNVRKTVSNFMAFLFDTLTTFTPMPFSENECVVGEAIFECLHRGGYRELKKSIHI